MLDNVKYVCVFNGLCDTIIVFPGTFQHRDFAHMGEILGAGFIRFNGDHYTYTCYGKSVSLDIGSRPVDTVIANSQLKGLWQ